MELGEKLRQARLEAGLSQRQLCGDMITRNMLSQIENGAARPSMATLQYLAGRLGKSLGFFLGEEGVTSPNSAVMCRARQAYAQRQYGQTLAVLRDYRDPDPLLDAEWAYLSALSALAYAEALLEGENASEAAPVLEQVNRGSIYYTEAMERRRKQLLTQAYQILERRCRDQEDYKQAYFYACKLRGDPL